MAHPIKRDSNGDINAEDLGQKLQKQVYDEIAELFVPEELFDEQKKETETLSPKNLTIQISKTGNNTPM